MCKKFFDLPINIVPAAEFRLRQVFRQGRASRMQVVPRQYRLLRLDSLKYHRGGQVNDDIRPVQEVDGVDVAGYAYVRQAPQGGVTGQRLLPTTARVRLDHQFHARKTGNDAHHFTHFFPEGGKVALSQKDDDFEPAVGTGQR